MRASGGRRGGRSAIPLVLWSAQGPGGEGYVAAFNLGAEPLEVALDSRNVDLPARLGTVEELWTGKPVDTIPVTVQEDATRGVAPGSTAIPVTLEPHGAVLLRHTA